MKQKQYIFFISFIIISLNIFAKDNSKKYFEKGVKAENKENYTEAYSFYKKSGNKESWLHIGDLVYHKNLDQDVNYKEIYDNLIPIAEAGDIKAQRYIGTMFDRGLYVESDTSKAIYWFEKSVKTGDKIAQNDLAWEYDKAKRYEDAFRYFQLSAEQGFAPAENNLAWYYEHGIGVEKNIQKAEDLYKKAAKQDHKEAFNNLGGLYQNSYNNLPEAAKWFEKAAQKGLKNAQRNIGMSYWRGIGVKQNDEKAVYWMQKAAEQDFDKAQLSLASFYYSRKNYPQALYWYEKAAENGICEAQFNVANMYFSGRGGERNHQKAVYWWEKAAEGGEERATRNLQILQ